MGFRLGGSGNVTANNRLWLYPTSDFRREVAPHPSSDAVGRGMVSSCVRGGLGAVRTEEPQTEYNRSYVCGGHLGSSALRDNFRCPTRLGHESIRFVRLQGGNSREILVSRF